jgi:hypothetical protein
MCLVAHQISVFSECIQLLLQLDLDDFERILTLNKFSMKYAFQIASGSLFSSLLLPILLNTGQFVMLEFCRKEFWVILQI